MERDVFTCHLVQLYERRDLYHNALSYTNNAHDAEDLVQMTMLRAWYARERFNVLIDTVEEDIRNWVFKIQKREYLNLYRSRKRALNKAAQYAMECDRAAQPAQESSVDLNRVMRSLSKLPSHNQEALRLICIDEHPYEEAARLARVRTGTMKSRLHRAQSQLVDLCSFVA
jgi:RNA polymerase sigma-70 factor (ECF subfamily)